jgi:hypothetical protein
MSVPANKMILGHYHQYHDKVISKYQKIKDHAVNISPEMMSELQCAFNMVIKTKELHVSKKGLNDDDMRRILRCLHEANVKVSKLDISHNPDLTDETVTYINAFQTLQGKFSLNIYGTQISSEGRDLLHGSVTYLQYQHDGLTAPHKKKHLNRDQVKPEFILFSGSSTSTELTSSSVLTKRTHAQMTS